MPSVRREILSVLRGKLSSIDREIPSGSRGLAPARWGAGSGGAWFGHLLPLGLACHAQCDGNRLALRSSVCFLRADVLAHGLFGVSLFEGQSTTSFKVILSAGSDAAWSWRGFLFAGVDGRDASRVAQRARRRRRRARRFGEHHARDQLTSITPAPSGARTAKASSSRSRQRPATYGPRSRTVTSTERALCVTRRRVPFGRLRCATDRGPKGERYHEAPQVLAPPLSAGVTRDGTARARRAARGRTTWAGCLVREARTAGSRGST